MSSFTKIIATKTKRLSTIIGNFPYLIPYAFNKPLNDTYMTLKWEQAYLEWYATNKYSGQGEIVELGCWLGSSTIPLAIGLENNRRVLEKDKRINAYDLFLWQSWMDRSVRKTQLKGKFKPGDSFVEEYKHRINSWKNRIEIHAGDLNQIGWQQENKIELLFNDASKSWQLANSIIRNFYPSLIPGVSTCIEQDFAHSLTPWIHPIGYHFKDYFEPLCHVPFSQSVVFKYVKSIPDDLLHTSYSSEFFSMKDIDSAFDYSLSLVAKDMQPNIWGAKVKFFIDLGDVDRAWYEFKKAVSTGLYALELIQIKKRYFQDRPL